MKRKLLLAVCVLLSIYTAWGYTYVDVSDKLVASGQSWPNFTSEKTGDSSNAPWQGSNITLEKVKGSCILKDLVFAEVYYDKKTGSKYTVSQTVKELDNGLYKFRIAVFARKENIWGDDNEKTDANNVRLEVKSGGTQNSTMITSSVLEYYELLISVTDNTLTINISGLDDNYSNWMGYTDASLIKVLEKDYAFPADASGMITNPTVTENANGWTITGEGGNTAFAYGNAFEYWKESAKDGNFDYYQIINNIPNGRYKLSAEMINSTNKEGNAVFDPSGQCGVYATSGETTVFAPVTVDAASDEEAFAKYETEEIEVKDGILRVGVKNRTTMTARFFVARNFILTFIEPVGAEDGVYYMYDSNTNSFLGRGADKGTRAVVDKYGVPFNWNRDNGCVEFLDWTGAYLNTEGEEIYTDNAVNTHWTLVPTADGYYLRSADNKYYAANVNNIVNTVNDESSATVWTLKTPEERNAIINAYVDENKNNVAKVASLVDVTAESFDEYIRTNLAGKDYTDRVGTPKFVKDGGNGSWEWNGVRSGGNLAYGENFAEAWLATGSWTQTISDLPSGIYKVTVNGFERRAANAIAYSLGEAGYSNVTSSYLKANGEQVQLKSWYDEVIKEGDSYNPNNTTQAATAFNNDKYKNEVFTYVGEDGELNLTIAKPNYVWDCWLLFNNVTLTFYDNEVSQEDASAILATATEQLNKPMKPSLYKALNAAKEVFNEDKSVLNYNALRMAIENTETSVISYANMGDYIKKVTDLLSTTNFFDKSTQVYIDYLKYKTAYENYQNEDCEDIENAEANALTYKVASSYDNQRYVNNTAQDFLAPGWTINGKDATIDGSGLAVNTWTTNETEGDIFSPFFELWVGSGSLPATTLQGTVSGLASNKAYDVSVLVHVQSSGEKVDNSITAEVVGGTAVDVTQGKNIADNIYIETYTATGVSDAEGNLTLVINVAANSNISWLEFNSINYEESDAEISKDFSELNAEIAQIEAEIENKFGFEEGEYAPYENIESLNMLAVAKAIDQERYYTVSAITEAVKELQSIEWNANAEEVNAIYDGSFASKDYVYETNTDVMPKAWLGTTDSHNNGTDVRLMWYGADDSRHNNPGLEATSTSQALFTKYGAFYGKEEGYTMPLKANTCYKLTFIYGGWGNGAGDCSKDGYVTISDPENNAITLTPSERLPLDEIAGQSSKDNWKTYEAYFQTKEAGNYVLGLRKDRESINQQSQYVYGDFELKKVQDATVEISALGYATFSSEYALDLSAIDGGTAYIVTDDAVEGNYIKLTEQTEAVPANTGLIIAGEEGTVTIPVVATANPLDNKNYLVAGTGAAAPQGSYVLSCKYAEGGKDLDLSTVGFYAVEDDQPIVEKGKAYLDFGSNIIGAKALYFVFGDGTATAIETAEVADADADGVIYNVAGQQVGKDYKGIVIKNGKKYLNK